MDRLRIFLHQHLGQRDETPKNGFVQETEASQVLAHRQPDALVALVQHGGHVLCLSILSRDVHLLLSGL